MKVLVVDDNALERARTIRLLVAAKHEVDFAKDAASALSAIGRRYPDVVVVESSVAGSGVELVKLVRGDETASHLYIVVTASRVATGDMKGAFFAGADDFIRKPFIDDELVLRVEGAERTQHWLARIRTGGGSLDLSQELDWSQTQAWTSASAAICGDVGDMMGTTLTAAPTTAICSDALIGAELPLTIAADRLDIRVSVSVDASSCKALAGALLGDENADRPAVDDMLREISNVAAGCFKRLAGADGHVLTTGLPVLRAANAANHVAPKLRRDWTATCPTSNATLRFAIELRIRENKHIHVRSLREGMVLAHDVVNRAGALLMKGGTRLTEAHVAHLPIALGDGASILVADVADLQHAA